MANTAIQALVNSAGDAMSNMYEVYISWPWKKDGEEIMTVRADGFKIPEAAVETYQISYHGQKIDVPKTEVTMDRKFDLTFRMDAAYKLHQQFLLWQGFVGNPVTGGVANTAAGLGTVKVAALIGQYAATKDGGYLNNTNPDTGAIKDDPKNNTIWTFKNVWVSKVSQPEFKTEGGDKITFTVTMHFGDCDYPGYSN